MISLEILVILFWHCVHGIFCIICVVASLIFLNIELEPQLDPDYLDYTEIGPQLDQSDLSQATNVARLLTLVALISVALDILGVASLRIPLLQRFAKSLGIAMTHGVMLIFWMAILIAGLSPLNILNIYLSDGTNSTSAVVAIIFVMEIIELVVLIILNVDEHLILDHIHRPNEV